nr:inorganic phosphate transporter [Blochmannia endosymbiont of Camponotus (Colobopsis) obliquus]
MHFFTVHAFADLDPCIRLMLIIALILTFIYEFINGFHDTANSVATVIYTCALRSQLAVTMSSLFNFSGVILSGLSVAYTIVYLLPTDIIMNNNSTHYLAMIFSMLLAAIIWNLGTWYLGLPASSSHTLIGTIIGVGLINSFTTNNSIAETLNITKLTEIIISLIISPLIGAILAGLIIFFLCYSIDNNNNKHCIHLTPTEKEKKDGKRQPAFWPRITLILSAAGVSFSHGANDGQKGIGLIMLILIGVIPSNFVINLNANTHDIHCTHIAVHHLKQYYTKHSEKITLFFEQNDNKNITTPHIKHKTHNTTTSPFEISKENTMIVQNTCNSLNNKMKKPQQILEMKLQNICYDKTIILMNIHIALSLLQDINNYNQLCPNERLNVRNILIYLANLTDQIAKIPGTSNIDKQILYNLHKQLLITVEYAPLWIIIAVALSLSFGTIIGWRRIASTIGQKIGKKEMTYAQGLSAQLTTGISISIASYTGMPVSTTHVLSSAVTGTMLAHGSGLQSKTIKNIILTWILTLPITITLTGILYWFLLQIIIAT